MRSIVPTLPAVAAHALKALPLAALMTVAAAQAEARPIRTAAHPEADAIRTRQAAMDEFNARMVRLDALMGQSGARSLRSRSAEAGR